MIKEQTLFRSIIARQQCAVILVSSKYNALEILARPDFEELKKKFGDHIRFNRLITEEASELNRTLHLGYSLYYLFFRDGMLAGILSGPRPLPVLEQYLKQLLTGELPDDALKEGQTRITR